MPLDIHSLFCHGLELYIRYESRVNKNIPIEVEGTASIFVKL